MELTVDRDREEQHDSILQPFHRWIHVHIGGFDVATVNITL